MSDMSGSASQFSTATHAALLPPVFLVPLARTGGTLFVTMLDAHPELAMSYEIYAEDLADEQGRGYELHDVVQWIEEAQVAANDDADEAAWLQRLDAPRLRTFFYRARRAGLRAADVVEAMTERARAGRSLEKLDDRLDLIDALMQLKMQRRSGARAWGGKAKADPAVLHRRHPQAMFFTMIRDGRDVLASMKHTGSFDADPQRVAERWKTHAESLLLFTARPDVRAMAVRYEELVREPERVLREVCLRIGVELHPDMLRFHERDLPLYRNPHGHLSHQQIQRGLTDESIGRWRRDLTAEEVALFEGVAGHLLNELGYGQQ